MKGSPRGIGAYITKQHGLNVTSFHLFMMQLLLRTREILVDYMDHIWSTREFLNALLRFNRILSTFSKNHLSNKVPKFLQTFLPLWKRTSAEFEVMEIYRVCSAFIICPTSWPSASASDY